MLENQDLQGEVIFILTISVSFITLLCFPRTRVAVLVFCSFVTNVSHDKPHPLLKEMTRSDSDQLQFAGPLGRC